MYLRSMCKLGVFKQWIYTRQCIVSELIALFICGIGKGKEQTEMTFMLLTFYCDGEDSRKIQGLARGRLEIKNQFCFIMY